MDAVATKVQKTVDGLKNKNKKLADENLRLKQQLQEAKQLHSRIRRIAKKCDTPTAPATDTA